MRINIDTVDLPTHVAVPLENADLAEGEAPEKLLRDLFRELNATKVRYCVMRNFDRLPHSVGSSDLDILLEPQDLETVDTAVGRALAANGGGVIARIQARSRYLKTLGRTDGRWWGLAIDLVADVDYQGMVYTRADTILAHAVDKDGIKVVAAEDAAVMGLVKELINNLEAEPEYRDDARQALLSHGAAAERAIEGFTEEVKNAFTACAADSNSSAAKYRMVGLAMRADLRRRNRARLPFIAISEIAHRFVRVWKRPGSVIVVTGTDGSGKSTILKSILPVLSRAFHRRVRIEHLRPNWMPALGVLLRQRSEAAGTPVTDPHAADPDGFLKSLFRLGYYYLDYTVGYYRKIFPLLVGRCHLVCFDRYFHDIIVDPRRMRIGLPDWILKLAFSLAPAPDLLLCLGGDPAKIFQRKPETNESEVRKQVAALNDLCKSSRHASLWVDTTCNLEESRNQALTGILETLGRRDS